LKCPFFALVVQKTKNRESDAARKAELEKRLEDVSGKLGGKPNKHKPGKGQYQNQYMY